MDNYIGSGNVLLNSDIFTWSSGISLNDHNNINDGNINTYWISDNNQTETIGVYFSETKLLDGIGLKWSESNNIDNELDLTRDGKWSIFYTKENISNPIEAEYAAYHEILPNFHIDDSVNLIGTDIYFKFSEIINSTGLKIVISELQNLNQ